MTYTAKTAIFFVSPSYMLPVVHMCTFDEN